MSKLIFVMCFVQNYALGQPNVKLDTIDRKLEYAVSKDHFGLHASHFPI